MRPCYICAIEATSYYIREVPVCPLCHAIHLPKAILESQRKEPSLNKPESKTSGSALDQFELDLGLDGLSWETQKTPTTWPPIP